MNPNGFTLFEVLVAAGILMSAVTILAPIITLLHQERGVQYEKRMLVYRLHDELQPFLWEDAELPAQYKETIENTAVTFNYNLENELIKGCANWENVKGKSETLCLYGKAEE
ncbi:hypothetical protein [Lentibacillus sediminis]|uniref:hypothetical protein n=1 Tax=Lentibacillus sediminis TaxID=1940529 RepID=UPI000C1C7E7E|nr:hypothetical protein [Lentibacillus sediminis]